jgi:hypothetical protein
VLFALVILSFALPAVLDSFARITGYPEVIPKRV